MSNGNFNTINVKQLNFTGNHIFKRGQPTMMATLDASGVGHHKRLCVDNLAVGKGDNDCIDLNYVLDVSGASKLNGTISDLNGTTGNLGQVITATATGWEWQDPSSGTVTVNNKWQAGNSGQGTSTIYHSNPSYPGGTDLARVGIGNFSGQTTSNGQAKATLDVDSGTFSESMRSSFKLGTISPNGVFQNAPFSAMMGDGNSLNGIDTNHGSSFILGHSCTLTGWSCAAIGRHNVVNMPAPGSNYGSKGAIALGNYAYAGIKGGSAGTGDIGFAIGTGTEDGGIPGQPTYSSNNNKFVIDISGNVGIGTNAPSAYLHVESTAPVSNYAVPQVLITADAASNYNQWASLELRGSYIGNTVPYGVGIRTTYGHDINYRTYGDFSIYTADKDNGNAKTDRLTVTSTGDIGIGTTTPQAKLEVSGGDALIHEITVGRGATDGTTTATERNTAVGYQALYNNTIGYNNVATGYQALNKNTTGQYNVATGMNALRDNLDGDDNTASGTSALELNTSGNNNVAIGTSALLNNKVGNNNVAIGYNAGPTTNNLSNTISIGANVTPANSNSCVIGNPSQNINVGIGTDSPDYLLDVYKVGNGTIQSSLCRGKDPNFKTVTWSSSSNLEDAVVGAIGLYYNANEASMVKFHRGVYGEDGFMSFTTGVYNTTTGGQERMRLDSSGRLGIGTTTPQAKLQVVGDISCNTLRDASGNIGSSGQVLSSTGSGLQWVSNTGAAIGINDLSDAYSDGDFNLWLGEKVTTLTSGTKNTSVGQDALKSQTTGRENVALGFEPLRDNTAGEWNIAVGAGALLSNANGGSRNIAIGSKALSDLNTTDAASNTSNGSNNVVIGDKAGNNEATGGVAIVTGGKNVLLGYRCSANKSDATNQIIIGAEALGIGDNSVVLGNSSITKTELKGNVGIGTTSPSAKLQVVGDISCNTLRDASGTTGNSGEVLSSTGSGLQWISNTGGSGPWDTSGVDIYYNGKVGIGTSNPVGALNVIGGIVQSGVVQPGQSGTFTFLGGYNPSGGSTECGTCRAGDSTQQAVNNLYPSGNLHGKVILNQTYPGYQEWVVPETGVYEIQAIGACGGSASRPAVPNGTGFDNLGGGGQGGFTETGTKSGGRAAKVTKTYKLTQGTILVILVGSPGGNGLGGFPGASNTQFLGWSGNVNTPWVYSAAGGGGGGTFVAIGNGSHNGNIPLGNSNPQTLSSSDVLLVAGGGSGASAIIKNLQQSTPYTSPQQNNPVGRDADITGPGTLGNGGNAPTGKEVPSSENYSGNQFLHSYPGAGGGFLADNTNRTNYLQYHSGENFQNGAVGGQGTIEYNGYGCTNCQTANGWAGQGPYVSISAGVTQTWAAIGNEFDFPDLINYPGHSSNPIDLSLIVTGNGGFGGGGGATIGMLGDAAGGAGGGANGGTGQYSFSSPITDNSTGGTSYVNQTGISGKAEIVDATYNMAHVPTTMRPSVIITPVSTVGSRFDSLAIGKDNTGIVALDVSGTIRCTLVQQTSDIRLKENIETITNAASQFTSLRGVSFNLKNDESKRKRYGVVAQEIEKVFPSMVYTNENKDKMETKSVAYTDLFGVAIETIKNLNTRLVEVEEKLKNAGI